MMQFKIILGFIFFFKSILLSQLGNEKFLLNREFSDQKFSNEKIDLSLSNIKRPNFKFNLWMKDSFFRGANIHPYKHFSPFSMRFSITKKDLIELKRHGANLIVANYPGVFSYYPPYGIDSLHLLNLDKIVNLTSELNMYLVIAIRSGPGRSLYTFFNEKREDEYFLQDSIAREKYIEMCKFIARRYKDFINLVGINFLLEPHSDDPVSLEPVDDPIYFNFVDELIKNIREIDSDIPIIVQPQSWAYPNKFFTMKKFNDSKIVYSFNMYFPNSFTNEKNDSSYPGFFYYNDKLVYVDSNYLDKFLNPVQEFKTKFSVPIFVNEYGGIRYKSGFLNYLKTLHQIFLKNGYHFAYYVWKSEWGEIDGTTFDEFNYEKGSSKDSNHPKNEIMKEFERTWNLK